MTQLVQDIMSKNITSGRDFLAKCLIKTYDIPNQLSGNFCHELWNEIDNVDNDLIINYNLIQGRTIEQYTQRYEQAKSERDFLYAQMEKKTDDEIISDLQDDIYIEFLKVRQFNTEQIETMRENIFQLKNIRDEIIQWNPRTQEDYDFTGIRRQALNEIETSIWEDEKKISELEKEIECAKQTLEKKVTKNDAKVYIQRIKLKADKKVEREKLFLDAAIHEAEKYQTILNAFARSFDMDKTDTLSTSILQRDILQVDALDKIEQIKNANRFHNEEEMVSDDIDMDTR